MIDASARPRVKKLNKIKVRSLEHAEHVFMSHDELHFSFVDQVFVKKKKRLTAGNLSVSCFITKLLRSV